MIFFVHFIFQTSFPLRLTASFYTLGILMSKHRSSLEYSYNLSKKRLHYVYTVIKLFVIIWGVLLTYLSKSRG